MNHVLPDSRYHLCRWCDTEGTVIIRDNHPLYHCFKCDWEWSIWYYPYLIDEAITQAQVMHIINTLEFVMEEWQIQGMDKHVFNLDTCSVGNCLFYIGLAWERYYDLL